MSQSISQVYTNPQTEEAETYNVIVCDALRTSTLRFSIQNLNVRAILHADGLRRAHVITSESVARDPRAGK